jgi:hypothetical protein
MMKAAKDLHSDIAIIPFAVHEAEMYRAERREKTLRVALTATAGLLLCSNAVWLILWCIAR